METVTIGCRFPNGYVLEVGLQTTTKTPKGGLMPMLARTADYKRVVLKGTHAHTEEMRKNRIQTPAMLNAAPYINHGVPKDVWEQWNKEHPNNWAVRSGNIFEVKAAQDPKNVKAAVADSMQRQAILQPLDQTKKQAFGPNGEVVETAVRDA